MKNAQGTQQEQVSFTKKTNLGNRSSDTLTAACFWWRGIWLLDENNAVEKETTRNFNKLPALGKLTSVFKPGRGKSLGSTMHIDLDPSVKLVRAPTPRSSGKVRQSHWVFLSLALTFVINSLGVTISLFTVFSFSRLVCAIYLNSEWVSGWNSATTV